MLGRGVFRCWPLRFLLQVRNRFINLTVAWLQANVLSKMVGKPMHFVGPGAEPMARWQATPTSNFSADLLVLFSVPSAGHKTWSAMVE